MKPRNNDRVTPVVDNNNTERSFRDKWTHNSGLAFAATLDETSDIFRWIIGRNGFKSGNDLRQFLDAKKRILDAGCGNGRVTALLRRYSDPRHTEVLGIDLVAAEIAQRNLADQLNVSFRQKDLLGDLSDLGHFDFIYCQEVLHHTSDPQRAFMNLCARLAPRGEIAIYVYKKKAPAREFVDDFVRERIAGMPYKEAMAVCAEITELGRVLARTDVKVTVPEVKILEIEAGEYDLQRFVYHFFMKCFWNPELSYDENIAVNYDWYHPQLATRHTLPEVEEWFREAALKVVQSNVDHHGITVRGARR